MFADFTWPLGEVMYWIHFLAKSAFCDPLPMEKDSAGELQAALRRNYAAHLGSASFERAGDPVADAGHGQHLAVLQRGEGAAVVEEATDLRAQRLYLLLHLFPGALIDVIGRGIAFQQADLAEIGQMPVEMPDLALELLVPEDVVGRGFLFRQRLGVVGDTEKAEAGEHREQLAILPMARELLELGEEVVEA